MPECKPFIYSEDNLPNPNLRFAIFRSLQPLTIHRPLARMTTSIGITFYRFSPRKFTLYCFKVVFILIQVCLFQIVIHHL